MDEITQPKTRKRCPTCGRLRPGRTRRHDPLLWLRMRQVGMTLGKIAREHGVDPTYVCRMTKPLIRRLEAEAAKSDDELLRLLPWQYLPLRLLERLVASQKAGGAGDAGSDR